MYFLSQTLRICYFSIFLELLHGYLLFAANLEDFHAIAKKLVPEQLASLAKMAINHSPQDRDYDYDDANEYQKQDEVNKQINKHVQRGHKGLKLSKIRLSNDATIDFEELVERVKKRLEKELQEKYSNTKNTEVNKFKERRKTTKIEKNYLTQKTETNSDESSDNTDEITNKPTKRDSNIHITVNTERYEYADDLEKKYSKNKKIRKDKIKTKNEKDYAEFKKIEIMKGDSYEDYEVPVKDANIYSSNEHKRFKIKQNSKSNKSPAKPKVFKDVSTIKEKSKISKANSDEDAIEDLKALENIAYDDIETEKTDINVKKKSNSGTFIPTRERYTMVTPNYVSPKPAERYDFDEPLPEKDRERENFKYFGNPPAKINKKVRLL